MNRYIYDRPAAWNAARYITRAYDHTLFTDMLYEEYMEFTEARILPDKLDALADIFFISIGALWKLGKEPYEYLKLVSPEALAYKSVKIARLRSASDNNLLTIVVKAILETDDLKRIPGMITGMLDIINHEFAYLGCEEIEAELAIAIVCDSNDTKDLVHLDIGNKGQLKGIRYRPPTERLTLLAESIQSEQKEI